MMSYRGCRASDKTELAELDSDRSPAGDSGRVGAIQGQEWVPGSFTKLMVAVAAADMACTGG